MMNKPLLPATEITEALFFDEDTFFGITQSYHRIEKAKGFGILLANGDATLQTAAVTDGQIVDFFLQDVSDPQARKEKIARVKSLVRCFDASQQQEVVRFYAVLISECVSCHDEQSRHWCCLCCYPVHRTDALERIKFAFGPCYRAIYNVDVAKG
jgi:hypothetical protein